MYTFRKTIAGNQKAKPSTTIRRIACKKTGKTVRIIVADYFDPAAFADKMMHGVAWGVGAAVFKRGGVGMFWLSAA